MSYNEVGMTLTEWLLFIAVIDGPIIAILYFIWRNIKEYTKYEGEIDK
tara:strand:- start:650 stop:793 length:144 start_codon:yes stop_codon:yes gene_type:complete